MRLMPGTALATLVSICDELGGLLSAVNRSNLRFRGSCAPLQVTVLEAPET